MLLLLRPTLDDELARELETLANGSATLEFVARPSPEIGLVTVSCAHIDLVDTSSATTLELESVSSCEMVLFDAPEPDVSVLSIGGSCAIELEDC